MAPTVDTQAAFDETVASCGHGDRIPVSVIAGALRQLGCNPSDAIVEELLLGMRCTNGSVAATAAEELDSTSVSHDEFSALCKALEKTRPTSTDLMRHLGAFKTKTNMMSRAEFDLQFGGMQGLSDVELAYVHGLLTDKAVVDFGELSRLLAGECRQEEVVERTHGDEARRDETIVAEEEEAEAEAERRRKEEEEEERRRREEEDRKRREKERQEREARQKERSEVQPKSKSGGCC